MLCPEDIVPGFWELIVLLIILVIVFGARQLPALGEAIGRALVNYRRARHSRDDIEVARVKPPLEDAPREPTPAPGDRRAS